MSFFATKFSVRSWKYGPPTIQRARIIVNWKLVQTRIEKAGKSLVSQLIIPTTITSNVIGALAALYFTNHSVQL